MEHFLATAKVVGHHGINKGITNPIRLTLSDGTVTHDAAFTYVNEHRAVMQLESGRTELNFVDSYQVPRWPRTTSRRCSPSTA